MRRFFATTALLVATVATAPGLGGQQVEDFGRTILRGVVFDATSGAPLHGAFVAPQGLTVGFLTDSLGKFALEMPSGAAFRIQAEQLGYRTVELEVLRTDARRPIMIGMKADPILLEGVTALVDRFQRRRSFFDGSVRAYDRTRLLSAGGQDALQFVSSRTGLVRPCAYDPLNYCVWRRGRLRRMEVCVDEMYAFDGARHLQLYAPQDFYLIEVYDRGLQVRAYTNRYVERTVDRGAPLRPLVMGC